MKLRNTHQQNPSKRKPNAFKKKKFRVGKVQTTEQFSILVKNLGPAKSVGTCLMTFILKKFLLMSDLNVVQKF